MAIVRTTPKETNTTGSTPPEKDANGNAVARPLDRTKSVVNQGGAPVARPSRAPRPAVAARAGTPVKTASAGSFYQDTVAELRRVVWPSRETVQSGTIVTIGLLIFFAIYIFGLDSLFSWLFHTLGLYPG